MTLTSLISPAESAGVIETTGSAIALAKLLQHLRTDSRARIVGTTSQDIQGSVTIIIAGGLAEVQHAVELAKVSDGVRDTVFFAKPDPQAMKMLMASIKLAPMVEAPQTTQETKKTSSNVRPIEELDITDMDNWNVHELRRYARSVEDFPLQGRNISRANRAELVKLLTTLLFPTGAPNLYSTGDIRPN